MKKFASNDLVADFNEEQNPLNSGEVYSEDEVDLDDDWEMVDADLFKNKILFKQKESA